MTEEQTKFLYSIADNMGTTGIEDFTCKDGEKMREIIKALEQPTSDDCVSRQAVLDCLTATGLKKFDFILDAREKVNNLPPVTPTRKVGKWIEIWDEDHLVILAYQCSECETMRNAKTNYCADCGAEMVGVEND